jgi:hypothetical protein
MFPFDIEIVGAAAHFIDFSPMASALWMAFCSMLATVLLVALQLAFFGPGHDGVWAVEEEGRVEIAQEVVEDEIDTEEVRKPVYIRIPPAKATKPKGRLFSGEDAWVCHGQLEYLLS